MLSYKIFLIEQYLYLISKCLFCIYLYKILQNWHVFNVLKNDHSLIHNEIKNIQSYVHTEIKILVIHSYWN